MKISSKIINISAIGIAFTAFMPVVFAETLDFVPTLGPTPESVVIIPENTGSNTAEGGSTLIPTNTGSNTAEGGSTLIPTNTGSNTAEGGSTLNPVIGGSNATEIPVTPVIDPTPTPVISGGGSSSSSSGSRIVLIGAPVINPILASTSCNYLESYLKLGANNDSSEIMKLQTFLKNIENINVDINGIFDNKTFEGVKSFQSKYLADIMGPWGSNTPSGNVFITTKNKINEIYCKTNLELTPEQLAQISAYKNKPTPVTTNTEGTIGATQTGINIGGNSIINSSSTPTLTPEVGSVNNDNNSNTASVGSTSIAGKIWNFVKWLFGY